MKKKMQNVSFNSLDDFFDFLPPDEQKIVQLLRQTVLDCLPRAKEKLSFNVPFYAVNKTICFIWPGSVWWGSKQSIYGVQFGFVQGHKLTNIDQHFRAGQRKQVILKTYQNIQEIDTEILRAMLYEAYLIDQAAINPRV
jgi:Domain of unknown function (DU1801)